MGCLLNRAATIMGLIWFLTTVTIHSYFAVLNCCLLHYPKVDQQYEHFQMHLSAQHSKFKCLILIFKHFKQKPVSH